MASTGPGVPYVLALGNIIEVVTYSQMQSQAGLFVRHYRVSAIAGTSGTLGAVAVKMDSVIATALKPCLGNNAQYRGVGCRKIAPLPQSPAAYENGSAGVGGSVGAGQAKQVSGIISYTSLEGGRRGRGRNYIPFPCQNDNDTDMTPIAGYVTRLQSLANVLFSVQTTSGVNNVTLTPVIWHRETFDYTDITAATARDKWATQRRRGDYGRINTFPV